MIRLFLYFSVKAENMRTNMMRLFLYLFVKTENMRTNILVLSVLILSNSNVPFDICPFMIYMLTNTNLALRP